MSHQVPFAAGEPENGRAGPRFPLGGCLVVFAVVLGVLALLGPLRPFWRGPDPVYPAPEENTNYAGYHRSNYPGVHGSHDAVSNEFNAGNGIFGKCTNTRIRDISDGTTNTLMVGERDLAEGTGAIWMRSINRDATHEDGRALVGVCHESQRLNDKQSPAAFGSMHEGIAQFLLGDGSVRGIQEGLSPSIYNHLAQRNDGEIIPEF